VRHQERVGKGATGAVRPSTKCAGIVVGKWSLPSPAHSSPRRPHTNFGPWGVALSGTIGRGFAPRFLRTPPRDRPCAWLILRRHQLDRGRPPPSCHSHSVHEKGRLVAQAAFPVLRRRHIGGRFQDLQTGGLSPGGVLLGCRCLSGQSRSVARTDAMVSHLRKMATLSAAQAKSATTLFALSPLLPLSTTAVRKNGAL
jgi:hypothetical protein